MTTSKQVYNLKYIGHAGEVFQTEAYIHDDGKWVLKQEDGEWKIVTGIIPLSMESVS